MLRLILISVDMRQLTGVAHKDALPETCRSEAVREVSYLFLQCAAWFFWEHVVSVVVTFGTSKIQSLQCQTNGSCFVKLLAG